MARPRSKDDTEPQVDRLASKLPRRPCIAVMPIPLAIPCTFLLMLLLLLLYTSASTTAPDVSLDNIITNAGADAMAGNNSEDGGPAYNRYGEDLFATEDDIPEAVDEAHVVVLTAANFSSFLAARRHVMVDFYVPWCSWSRKLAPEYAAAASHLADTGLDVALAKVDVARNNQLARAHDVLGSPTVYFFVDGAKGYRYYGERTKDAIVAWITKKLGPAVQNITTVDEAEKIVADHGMAVLAFLDSLSGAHSDKLAAASRLEDSINVYQTASPDVAELFGVDPEARRPLVVMLEADQEGKLTWTETADGAVETADAAVETSTLETGEAAKTTVALETGEEEQRYNRFLLEQHRLVEGQIDNERPSQEAVTALAAMNPNFIAEHSALYDTRHHAQDVVLQEVAAAEAQLHAIADVNIASCDSYALPMNYRMDRFDDDSAGATISIVDLMCTGEGHGNSTENE
ncbi:protein disulfide isomerase family protein 2-2 [Hordeum vulgare]|nr:protein disulfide isomerase family protein 2-2 [Hordeum vulgare]